MSFFRILLGLQEMVTIKRSLRCKNAGAAPFPLWVLCFNYISHVLLVLNCSVNSLSLIHI